MPNLFDAAQAGDLHLRNRIVMAPLTRCRATDNRVPTALMAQYYQQRAGAGLIISEATAVSPQGIRQGPATDCIRCDRRANE